MGTTVAQILALPIFENAEIVAPSKKNLKERIVDNVTLLMSEDQLTGENITLQDDFVIISPSITNVFQTIPSPLITEIAKCRASAICIPLNRSKLGWNDVLQSYLRMLPLPIILMSSSCDISKLISSVTYEILRNDGYDTHLSFEENFFQELVVSDKDESTLEKRAAMIGIKVDENLGAVLIQPDDSHYAQKVLKYCRQAIGDHGYAISKNNRVLLIIRVSYYLDGPDHWRSFIEEFCNALMAKFPEVHFRFGVGRSYNNICDFRTSFYESRTALNAVSLAKDDSPIIYFRDLGIYQILFDLRNKEALRYFCQETMGAIRDYDQKNNTAFLPTIKAYIANNCSINDTAEAMFVHYNTIRYRIRRIQQLFGYDLDNENDRVNLQIAINVMSFIMEDEKY